MIIKDVIRTEKAVRENEEQNTLVLIVERKANKAQIKAEAEKLFSVKVVDVRTMITPTGEKKAYVKLSKEFKASDIMNKIGFA